MKKGLKKLLFGLAFIGMVVGLTACASYGEGNYSPSGSNDYPDSTAGEEYNKIRENPEVDALKTPSSYFSMDSNTASYANLRRYINEKQQISGDIIKTDELINYFNYDMEKPTDGEAFAATTQVATCPWNTLHKLVTIGIAAKEIDQETFVGNNLVFLIDVSGSMSSENKLPLIKQALAVLLDNLDASDTISIVTYASGLRTVIDGVKVSDKNMILSAVNKLRAYGSTNGERGLEKAYELAQKHFKEGGNNRVLIASDGDFNVGISSQTQLQEFISGKKEEGVYLTTLGFGMGNYKDTTMETLAKYGNGVYAYIDSYDEAKKVLVDDLQTTLYTVAKDVKAGVTFDPSIVKNYRLIGYENKTLSEDEYNDDTKDAGEIGSGHTTMVCYEIELQDELDASKNAFTLNIHYKDPETEDSLTYVSGFSASDLESEVNEDFTFVSCLVEFSLILRNSAYRGSASYRGLLARLESLDCVKTVELRKEFYELVKTCRDFNLTYQFTELE
jgi:Ca-activated chloride channel family protein